MNKIKSILCVGFCADVLPDSEEGKRLLASSPKDRLKILTQKIQDESFAGFAGFNGHCTVENVWFGDSWKGTLFDGRRSLSVPADSGHPPIFVHPHFLVVSLIDRGIGVPANLDEVPLVANSLKWLIPDRVEALRSGFKKNRFMVLTEGFYASLVWDVGQGVSLVLSRTESLNFLENTHAAEAAA